MEKRKHSNNPRFKRKVRPIGSIPYRRLFHAFGLLIRYIHLKDVNGSVFAMDQMRHLLRPNTGLDIELCKVASILQLDSLQNRLQNLLVQGLNRSNFIASCRYASEYNARTVCKYASEYNARTVLSGCFIWLKRFFCKSFLSKH